MPLADHLNLGQPWTTLDSLLRIDTTQVEVNISCDQNEHIPELVNCKSGSSDK